MTFARKKRGREKKTHEGILFRNKGLIAWVEAKYSVRQGETRQLKQACEEKKWHTEAAR